MHHSFRPLVRASCWLLAIAILGGCKGSNENTVEVKGRLVKNGQAVSVDVVTDKPLPPGDTGRIKVMFFPVKEDNDVIIDSEGNIMVGGAEMATVESDGSFHLGKGAPIRAGKYRIAITHIHPLTGKDLLNGMFSAGNSRITRNITGKEEIVIDLGKPTG